MAFFSRDCNEIWSCFAIIFGCQLTFLCYDSVQRLDIPIARFHIVNIIIYFCAISLPVSPSSPRTVSYASLCHNWLTKCLAHCRCLTNVFLSKWTGVQLSSFSSLFICFLSISSFPPAVLSLKQKVRGRRGKREGEGEPFHTKWSGLCDTPLPYS